MLHAVGALPGEMAYMTERGHGAVLGIFTSQGVQQTKLQVAQLAHPVSLGDAIGQAFAPHVRINQKTVRVEDRDARRIEVRFHDNLR